MWTSIITCIVLAWSLSFSMPIQALPDNPPPSHTKSIKTSKTIKHADQKHPRKPKKAHQTNKHVHGGTFPQLKQQGSQIGSYVRKPSPHKKAKVRAHRHAKSITRHRIRTRTITRVKVVKVKVFVPKDVPNTIVVHRNKAIGVGLAAIVLLCLLGLLLLWAGYIIGFKDSDRKNEDFLRALRDRLIGK